MISADNQQATPLLWESPQRLYAEYPKEERITTQESILLGILYTDGCLSKKTGNGWRFYLSNTSAEIIQTFRQCMIEVFGLGSRRIRISQKLVNGKPFYKAVVDSAYCGSILTAKYGTFRTLAFRERGGRMVYPPAKLPFTSNTDHDIISNFLRAAFSCDGGVNLYVGRSKSNYKFLIRNIYLACKHPQLQLDYQRLLSSLGIRSKILARDNRILIQRRLELEKFREKIGFLDGVKITQHSAFWQGWEKNKVLDLALFSYGRANVILSFPQFLG